jgi:hypothetical protein
MIVFTRFAHRRWVMPSTQLILDGVEIPLNFLRNF